MSMIGPYIVIAAGLPPGVTGVDVLLLVEWQKGPGHVTEVSPGQINLQIAEPVTSSAEPTRRPISRTSSSYPTTS